MNKKFKFSLLTSLLITASTAYADISATIDDSHNRNTLPQNKQAGTNYLLDLGWDSKYIAEGRDELGTGGTYWGTAAVQHGNLNIFALIARADTLNHTEWNFGLEYLIPLSDTLEATVGYQRLEFYGDERANDNEFFSSLTYNGIEWLTPSINYTYATEAGGYFVEASLHSSWELLGNFTLTPYITQAFDFQFATEDHNGPNHFQFGVEAEYLLNEQTVLSGHISHTIAQKDIKLEAEANGIEGSLNQTYAGVHLTWNF